MKQCWSPAFPDRCPGVSKAAVMSVALALADVVNDTHGNQFYGSVDRLAVKARVTRKQAGTVIAHLVDAGVIALVQRRPGRSTLYRWLGVNPSRSDPGADSGGESIRPETRVDPTRDPKETVNDTQEALDGLAAPESPPDAKGRALVTATWYYEGVKARTGKPPIGITFIAVAKIAEAALKGGWTEREVRAALRAVYDEGRTLTRQVLEAHLDGRARRRRQRDPRDHSDLLDLRFDEAGHLVPAGTPGSVGIFDPGVRG